MVHVKVDTKQNLCASRTQSPELYSNRSKSPANNDQIQPQTATIIKPKTSKPIPKIVCAKPSTEADLSSSFLDNSKTQLVKTEQTLDDTIVVVASQHEVTGDETVEVTATDNAEPSCLQPAATDELINFTSSSFMGKILRGLRWKRKNAKDSVFKESRNVSFRGGKRTTNFLRRSARWFGSGKSTKSTNSCTGLFDQHHISGITCSDSGNCEYFIAFFFFMLDFLF